MPGFFGDYDIEGAADDPFGVPAGTYRGTITEFDGDISGTKKDGSGEYQGIQWEITITEGKQEGGIYPAYFSLPVESTSPRSAGFMRSAIKKFLAGCEIAEDRMNEIDPNELVGLDVIFKVVERKGKDGKRTFKNLDSIRLDNGAAIGNGEVTNLDIFVEDPKDDEFGL